MELRKTASAIEFSFGQRFGAAVLLSSLAIGGCSQSQNKAHEKPTVAAPETSTPQATRTPSTPTTAKQLLPNCAPVMVRAQNRFLPPGAALRSKPSRDKKDIVGSFAPNATLLVDGWTHSGTIYAEHTKADKYGHSFENDVMLHVAGNQGYVAYQAVRNGITEQAKSNLSDDIGRLVDLLPNCEIK